MWPLRDLPIRRKLLVVNVLSSGLALLLVSAAFFVYELIGLRRTVEQDLRSHAAIIGYNAASAIEFDDRESAQRTLAALRAESDVLAAAIYRADGPPFASYRRPDVHETPWMNAPLAATDDIRFERNAVVFSRPVVVEGERLGTVRIVADLMEQRARILGYLGIIAGAFLVAIASAVLLSSRLQRAITGPIFHLVERARRVSEARDYAIRATPEGQDELGLLVRSFNDMLQQIQERDGALRYARDEAERANRAKDEFLAIVSHELRTPLTPILSWIRLLKSNAISDAQRRQAFEVIERNARAQGQLVNDLLDVSRIISGKIRLDVQQVDPAGAIEAAIESVRPAAEARGIDLQLVVDPRAGLVAGDGDRLQQVFWNLLSNAIKFTPRGGRVQVQVRRVNSHVEVSVGDTGQGIEPEFLPFVFDRFRQADSSTTRRHGGLGLGLAIVRHLVELHGGRVRAESEGANQGSVFTVELPVSLLPATGGGTRVHPTATTGAIPFEPTPVLRGVRVLVVDDDHDTLETVSTVLTACGAEVITADSAATGLARLQADRPDLLVSDIGMPGEDGYAFIGRVRALPPESGGTVRALALTAYARVEDRVKVLSAGFQMHVPKPIEPAELVALVASLAEWPTA